MPEDLTMTSPTESGSYESSSMLRGRTNSTNDAAAGRPVKHRSSQACQSCRMRKVRCDVTTNGSRCTNCRLDHTECVVLASRRGKNNRNRRSSTNSQIVKSFPPQSANSISDSASTKQKRESWASYESINTPVIQSASGSVPACVTFDEDSDRPRSAQPPESNDATRNGHDHASSEAYNGLPTPGHGTNPSDHYQSPTSTHAPLPAFIAPLSSRILSEDLDFLAQKGALTVPEPDLRVEILRGYLFSVHPFMPMLDFRTFVHAVLNDREDARISLLLFQAVMFAGLHSLQPDVIHRLGFKSVKQARKVFYDRVRLLYDFDIEMDNAALLQSTVLMSLWYGTWNDRRHTWHWTGLAYDVARSMGLHREPTTRHTSDKVLHFRRRLWWSLYIRDRLIALGTRRPRRIRDEDFDVAMLTLEDFDLAPLEEPLQGHPLVPNSDESTSAALMCIQLAKLCICIGHVTSSQYTVLSTQPDVPHTMMVVPRRIEGHNQELDRCDRELSDWFQALGTNIRRNSSPTVRDGEHSCSEVHWSILNITYLTVVNVLHRARASQSPSDTSISPAIQSSSRSKVKDAARSLTKISQTMLRHDQVRFLGPVGVTALVAACLSHLLDVSSGDEDVRDASTFRLHQSLQVLQSLRSIYASADAGVSFLTSVTQKAGVHIHAQIAAPAAELISTSSNGLVRPPVDGLGTTLKDAHRSSHDGLSMLNEQSGHRIVAWQASSIPPPVQSTHDRLQNRNLREYEQVPYGSSVMQPGIGMGAVSPSAVALPTPKDTSMSNHGVTGMMRNTPITGHRTPQFTGAVFGGPLVSGVDGAFLDWNNGMDSGMDFEHMAFNYDFYSSAFEP